MQCPKCLTSCADDAAECLRCRVVFAKIAQRSSAAPEAPATAAVEESRRAVVPPADPLRGIALVGRIALLAGALLAASIATASFALANPWQWSPLLLVFRRLGLVSY